MANNYSPIAAVYDPLNHLVFGKATERAQYWLLQYVPPHSSILVVGGGTGWILDALSALHSTGLKIYYVECAERMMAMAQKKDVRGNDIRFYLQPVESFLPDQQFDVVITPFVLDNFTDEGLLAICDKVSASLKPDGLWLAADFILEKNSPIWQRLLLWVMYRFFAWTCHVSARVLPNWPGYFASHNYYVKAQRQFYQNFIRATVYAKSKPA